MRILFVAWRDLVNELAGGSEVLIDHLADGLSKRGHDVALMCAEPVGTPHGRPRTYRVMPNGSTVGQYGRAPLNYLRHFRDRDIVIDVANGLSFYTPLWRRGPSVCFVNHIHTQQWSQWFPRPLAAVGRTLEHKAMPAAYRNRLFVAVSASTAEGLISLGVDPNHIRVVHNGAHVPDQIGTESPEPLFMGMGRMVPHKRYELLVRAWERVRPHTGGRLVIAGEGPERANLEAIAGRGVELPGRITEEEKAQLLGSSWLMIHPASHEGWGLVILEAAAYGTPALGFRVPGLRDSIVDGHTGHLVDTEDELVAAWIRLATDHAHRQELRLAARERAKGLSWENTVDHFAEVCEEAVALHRRPPRRNTGSWTASHAPEVEPAKRPAEGRQEDVERSFSSVSDDRHPSVWAPSRHLSIVQDRPELSIVIPAYNESARLPISMPELLDTVDPDAEIIVVDDGSSDDTRQVATDLLRGRPRSGVLSLGRHEGKGAAVRAGMSQASGASIMFMDADLATDLTHMRPLLERLERSHIVIGSRSAPGAVTSGLTPSSDAAHRAFNALARSTTGMDITDFQCGFKAFRAPEGKLLFHLLEERGFAFDVELLALADRIGYGIAEVPVHWRAVRGSHVRIVVDSAVMTTQIARIAVRTRIGKAVSSLEAWGRSPEMSTEELTSEVRGNIGVQAPVVPWKQGALALLPFLDPPETEELAADLRNRLPGVLIRPSVIAAGSMFEPAAHRLRSALAAS